MLRAWPYGSWCAPVGLGVLVMALAASVSAQEAPPSRVPDEPAPEAIAPAGGVPEEEATVQLEAPVPVAIDVAPVEPCLHELPTIEGETDDTDVEEPIIDEPNTETGSNEETTTDVHRLRDAAIPPTLASAAE